MAEEKEIYTFEELSPKAQEKACDNSRYANVEVIEAWYEAEYYETWLNEKGAERGVSFDVEGTMDIKEEYNRWWFEIEKEFEVEPPEVDKWILATPTPKVFGFINHYRLFVSNFEALLEKKKKWNLNTIDAEIESQKQTMLSFLKGNLEGVKIALHMDCGDKYSTHRQSSTWMVDSITIERTIEGEKYVYEQEEMIWNGDKTYDDAEYFSVDGLSLDMCVEGGTDELQAQSVSDNVFKPIFEAAVYALAPMFKEWFDEHLDYLAQSVGQQYDYLISDEGIGEWLIGNESEFDKDGNAI